MWGSEGEGNGQFLQPHGIGIDSKDNLYVTDAELLNVQRFDSNGNFITKWGSVGEAGGQFAWLESVDTDSRDNVYVVDMDNERVQKFTSDGQFISNGEQGARQTANSVSQQESLLMLQIMYI
jgi:DNA-binding beta-propeller fold protein YncE